MSEAETVIVGAGPYGLSIAAHLRAAGLSFRIFGSPMESWRSCMPRGMFLKSERFASNLWDPRREYTLERYSAERGLRYPPSGRPLPLSDFLDYADWFQRRAVPEVTDVKVREIAPSSGGYTLALADGTTTTARTVILATGHMAFPVSPPELALLPEPACVHSSRLHDLSGFAGRDVTVVGAGQSALETATLLHEIGARVRLLAREHALRWNDPPIDARRPWIDKLRRPHGGLGPGWDALAVSELPRVFRALFPADKRHRYVAASWGPSGAHWLRARFEGKVEVLTSHRLRAASRIDGRVRLDVERPGGTATLITDHVVAATGFEVDLDRMTILSPELRASLDREGRAPALDAAFETSSAGLFVVGVASAPTFGPVMRFMFGAKHAAPIVTARLLRRAGAASRPGRWLELVGG
jgi:hypothetical protein